MSIIKERLNRRSKDELLELAETIVLAEPETIGDFGANISDEMNELHKEVMHAQEKFNNENTGEIWESLERISENFDIGDVKKEIQDKGVKKKGFFGWFLNKKNDIEDKISKKFRTLQDEVERINNQITEDIAMIDRTIEQVEKTKNKTFQYLGNLMDHVQASEMKIDYTENVILKELKEEREKVADDSDEALSLDFEIKQIEETLHSLKMRSHNLNIQKSIAMQQFPILDIIIKNYRTSREDLNTHSSLTMSNIMQSLNTALNLRTQIFLAKDSSMLREKNNEYVERNADLIKDASIVTEELSNQGILEIETLEKSWDKILEAIKETKEINQKANKEIAEKNKRLNELGENYQKVQKSEQEIKLKTKEQAKNVNKSSDFAKHISHLEAQKKVEVSQ